MLQTYFLPIYQQSGAGDVTYYQLNGEQNTSIPESSFVLGLLNLGLLGIGLKLISKRLP